MRNIIALTGVSLLVAQSGYAFEFAGADFAGGYSAFFDQVNGETLSRTSGEASLELTLGNRFGAQLDIGVQKFEQISDDIEDNSISSTIHGLYYLNDATTLGAFYGKETLEKAEYLGVEAVYYGDRFDAEAYFGLGAVQDFDGSLEILGLRGAYGLGNSFDLIGSYSLAAFDDVVDLSLYEIGLEYKYSDHIRVSASYGRSNIAIENTETNVDDYFALEAEYSLGSARGATFGERGVLNLIPGL